jgi:polyphosphate kinase 2 (PPK2 family)
MMQLLNLCRSDSVSPRGTRISPIRFPEDEEEDDEYLGDEGE